MTPVKSFFIILLFSASFTSLTLAQQASVRDSVRVQRHQQVERAAKSDAKASVHRPAFRDENGDGLDDRSYRSGVKQHAQQAEGRVANVDCFIDKDGDGINDDRCGAMGITPSMTNGKQKGKQK